jgi:ATP/maltotriose-dependent transcriptional regulator MalT
MSEPIPAVPSPDPLARLSRRELDVLEMVAGGLSNREAGASLNVTVHAVKFHLAAIYGKLGVHNRTAASALYLRSVANGSDRAGG